jgi:small subunit ribosomal protein S13
MIYIFETELVVNKSIVFALQKIYGIGKAQSLKICKTLGFSSNFKIIDLTTDQLKKLTKTIETSGLIITTELKKKKSFALKELVNLKTYRGIRRIKGLPVRGQRTHTNGKTAKLRRS